MRVRFPNVSKEQEQRGRALLEKEIPTWDMHMPLADIQASLAVTEGDFQSSGGLDFTPPRILISQEPAVLLLHDGAPIEHDVAGSGLRRVATEPAELFLFEGAPHYAPVDEKADLLYVVNTENTVLVEEAEDAVADTMIPQTATVRRDQTFLPTYDGAPQFEKVEGTSLAYAVNTPDAVIQDAGRYWACDQGVWYVASSAEGPYAVSDQRPPHVDQLPPSVPVYHIRYVYVYRSTPQVVFVGFTPGYVSVFPSRGVVVFGTGFHHRPWVSPVVFFPRPATFGFRVVFNPWTGFVFIVSPSTRFVTVGIHFGPRFGPRPIGWWGPVPFRPVVFFPPPLRAVHRPPPGFRPPPPALRPPTSTTRRGTGSETWSARRGRNNGRPPPP